jgi:hypothetical protein
MLPYDYKKLANRIKKDFDEKIVQIKPLVNGVQVSFTDKDYRINFYYKSLKYIRTDNHKAGKFAMGNEKAVILNLIKSKKRGHSTATSYTPVCNANALPAEPDNVGTKACIAHVLNKAEAVGKVKGADHALAAMLVNLAKEFEQYL